MAQFNFAYQATNQAEGKVIETVPGDHGGETYWGLTRADADADWLGWAKIDSMRSASGFPGIAYQDCELNTLHKLYCQNKYWKTIGGDDLSNQAVANKIYDIGFNEGVEEAIRFVQESINLLNYNANTKKGYITDLKVDGVMGSLSLEAIQTFCALGMSDYLLKSLEVEQGARYKDIVRAEPSQRKFFKGWLNRTFQEGATT